MKVEDSSRKLKSTSTIRLLILFVVAFSLASIAGPLSSHFQLPTIPVVRAQLQPCTQFTSTTCSQPWVPAGPSTNTETALIFPGQFGTGGEFNCAFPSTGTPCVDITDWPINPTIYPSACPATVTRFSCTSTISEHGYDEIQFMLDNNYWGVDMGFAGSDAGSTGIGGHANCLSATALNCAGLNIRQGVSHLVDKISFTCGANTPSTACDPACGPIPASAPPTTVFCQAIDNPLPLSLAPPPSPTTACATTTPPSCALPTPINCTWDVLYPEVCGSAAAGCDNLGTAVNCGGQIGDQSAAHYTGGTAYHIARSTTSVTLCGAPFNWLPCANGPTNTLPNAVTINDFCAAAQHIADALNAVGEASTTLLANCQVNLTNPTAVNAHPVFIYARNDDNPRFDLGEGLAAALCAIFTGAYTTSGGQPTTSCGQAGFNCSAATPTGYVCFQQGPITNFQGFLTDPTSVKKDWWIYTGAFISVFPFDSTLFFLYNSHFTSGFSAIQAPPAGLGTCSDLSTGSFSASDYMYLCNAAYDSVSNAMEVGAVESSGSAVSEPTVGTTTTPTFAACTVVATCTAFTGICTAPPTSTTDTHCTNVSAGYQTEDIFGQGAYTVPFFTSNDQFGFSTSWASVVNNQGLGAAGFFNWLNTYPLAAGATVCASGHAQPCPSFVQGFKETTRSLNPYEATTAWDFYVLSNIMDQLAYENPVVNSQLVDWMTITHQLLPNAQLAYTPPTGTVATYRFFLRPDATFSNGNPVTSFDVAFSALSLLATGAFQSTGLAPIIGITILSPTEFDMNLNFNNQLSTLIGITGTTVFPGQYWTLSSSWTSDLNKCLPGNPAFNALCYNIAHPSTYSVNFAALTSQGNPAISCISDYSTTIPTPCPTTFTSTLAAGIPAGDLNVDANKVPISYDPLANGALVGSGPWVCAAGAGQCTATGNQNPVIGSTFTLNRFGITQPLPPKGLTTSIYFRSPGRLAEWFWSGITGTFTSDVGILGKVESCLGFSLTSVNNPLSCIPFEEGIVGWSTNGVVTSSQISTVAGFVGVNWVFPFDWHSAPPTGIISFAPTLYNGVATVSGDAFAAGSEEILQPASAAGVGCSTTTPFPTTGYDC